MGSSSTISTRMGSSFIAVMMDPPQVWDKEGPRCASALPDGGTLDAADGKDERPRPERQNEAPARWTTVWIGSSACPRERTATDPREGGRGLQDRVLRVDARVQFRDRTIQERAVRGHRVGRGGGVDGLAGRPAR